MESERSASPDCVPSDRPRYIEGQWYVPVGDLHEALDALEGLYDSLPRYSCKAAAPDGCPVCVARDLLKASNRK